MPPARLLGAIGFGVGAVGVAGFFLLPRPTGGAVAVGAAPGSFGVRWLGRF